MYIFFWPCLAIACDHRRPVQSPNEAICPSYRTQVCCDDATLFKIRHHLETTKSPCLGCRKNLEAFLCHAFCTPRHSSDFPVNPVFCAAGQLACADDSFCRPDGPLATSLTAVSGSQAVLSIVNDFALMPLSAHCDEPLKVEPTVRAIEKKSNEKLWMIILGGLALGIWISSRRPHPEKRNHSVWLPVQPEDSSRL